MTKAHLLVCPRCLGVVRAPRRGVTLEQSMTNHEASCPSLGVRKDKQ
jgi:hypothetical protein